MGVDGRIGNLFDDLAQLAAQTVSGGSALLLMRDNATNRVTVVGRHGTLYTPPPHTARQQLLGPDDHVVTIPDIATDPRMEGHPLRNFIPKVKSMLLARISSRAQTDIGLTFAVAIYDVADEAFENNQKMNNFTHVLNVCRQFVGVVSSFEEGLSFLSPEIQQGLSASVGKLEEPAAAHLDSSPTSRFLFETLPKKQILHERNGSCYVSLRKWQRDIKEHQLSALFATKITPPQEFINEVADEMADCVKKLYGVSTINIVVPVPGGSSQQTRSLSEKIAERLAEQLRVECRHVLQNNGAVTKGRSHPIKSASMKAYSVKEKVNGCVLLVDDVASSGKHLELAQSAIRESGATCFAMSWIGP